MKFIQTAAALASVAGLASAQLPASAPECAVLCFSVKITEAGTLAPGVDPTNIAEILGLAQKPKADVDFFPRALAPLILFHDVKGLCQVPEFVTAYAQCLADNCSTDNARTGVELGQQVCASYGVGIATISADRTGSAAALLSGLSTIPVSSASTTAGAVGGAAGSASATVTSAASSAIPGASSAASGAAATATSGLSSLSSIASSVAETLESGASGAAGSATSGAAGAASTATSAVGGAASTVTSGGAGAASTLTSGAAGAASTAVSGASSVGSAVASGVTGAAAAVSSAIVGGAERNVATTGLLATLMAFVLAF